MVTMLAPDTYTESEALVGYLEDQLDAIRASAYGLTDAQARETPCRSTLSVGGLVKHVTYVMRGRAEPSAVRDPHSAEAYEAFTGSFALTSEESLAGALSEFDRVRTAYVAAVAATDPGATYDAPPAPWYGRPDPTPATERFALVHHVEELARHAGHADIVREQVDGAQSGPLMLAVKGLPGNDFMQPWSPGG